MTTVVTHTTKGSNLVPCIYHYAKSVCFSIKTRGWFLCSQKQLKIYKQLHKTPLVFLSGACKSLHLTIFLMVLACHIDLTNSVYLQEHHATLCTCCQLVSFLR